MKIAICDDTNLDLKLLEQIILEYSKANSFDIIIDTYDDPRILINRITYFDPKEYDIYFLDICMQENGIEVAEKIRKLDNDCYIIFATSSKDYAIDAFKVRALDYVLKPINKPEVFECLNRIFEATNSNVRNVCSIKTNDHNLVTVDIKNITFIESNNRRMVVHLFDKTQLVSTSLRSKFLESIPFDYQKHNFIYCHSSYIVNMNYIKAISDYAFILKNNEIVPISKRAFAEVKDKYIKYLVGE